MSEPEFGLDVDGRYKPKSMFIKSDAPVAPTPVSVAPAQGRVMRLDDWCGTNGPVGAPVGVPTPVTPVTPVDELDPSMPSRPVVQRGAPLVTPALPMPVVTQVVTHNECPSCFARRERRRRAKARKIEAIRAGSRV